MLNDKDLKTHSVSFGEVQLDTSAEDMLRMASAKSLYVECGSEFAVASVVKLGSSFLP